LTKKKIAMSTPAAVTWPAPRDASRSTLRSIRAAIAACASETERAVAERLIVPHIRDCARESASHGAAATPPGTVVSAEFGLHGISMPERLVPAYLAWLGNYLEIEAARISSGSTLSPRTSGAPSDAAPSPRGDSGANSNSSALSISAAIKSAPIGAAQLAEGRFRDSSLYNAVWLGLTRAERAHVWPACARAHESYAERLDAAFPRSPAAVVAASEALCDANVIGLIERDICRAFPGVVSARPGIIVRMYRLLRAYAHYNTRVGYTQGMHTLAGTVAMFVDDDGAALCVLRYIVEHVLVGYFEPTMAGAHADADVLRYYVRRRIPRLDKRLRSAGIDLVLFTLPWFSQLFMSSLPVECALRVWDRVLLFGPNAMIEFALRLLVAYSDAFGASHDIAATSALLQQRLESTFDFDALSDERVDIGSPLLPFTVRVRRSEALRRAMARLRSCDA
jgi:hypothetical protein